MPVVLDGTAAISGDRVGVGEPHRTVTTQNGVLLKNNNTWFKTSLHGLGPAAFDRTGNISLLVVCKILELGRTSAVGVPSYVSNCLFDAPKYMDIVTDYHLERAFYKRIYQQGMNISLDVTHQLAGFGKTSVDYVTTVVDPIDEEVLARQSCKCSSVDLQTRKATPIPDSIKERYAKYCARSLMTKQFRTQEKPENATSMSYTVRSSDIDANLHMNHCGYFRLFSNAADEALQRGLFKQFTEDILLYHPKTMQALYIKECKRGETLEVYTWEDDEIPLKLNCVMEKDGEPVCCGNIEFYFLEIGKL